MRATSQDAQRLITEAALSTFCQRGYVPATLEEIGAAVGLTRGAVLHHFKSKAGLLAVVVEPCRRAFEQVELTMSLHDPPTLGERRELLARFADLFLTHRGPLRLLVNDISARVQLGLDDQWFMPTDRLLHLLVGSNADHRNQVRVAAAIGAMVQPVTWAWVDLDDPATRAGLIEAALAIFPEPGPPGSPRNRKIPAVPFKVPTARLARGAAQ